MTSEQTGGPQARVPDPDAVREEAERLVATGLAAVSMVAERIGAPTRERGGSVAAGYDAIGDMLFGSAGHRHHSVANESPECCRCPVCRVISAAREPNPNVAEALATGVGTVAGGAARVLRGLAGAAGTVFESRPGPGQQQEPPVRADLRQTDPWAAATAGTSAPPSAPGAASAPVEPPVSKVAKKTTAKKVTAKKVTAKKTTAKKTTAKKATAKKAAKKAPPPGEGGQ